MLTPPDVRAEPTTEQAARNLAVLASEVYRLAADFRALGPQAERMATGALGRVDNLLAEARSIRAELAQARPRWLQEQLSELGISPDSRELKLHIGSGGHNLQGWVNLDVHPAPLCWNVQWGLPFADGAVSHAFVSHLLEHLFFPNEAGEFLRELRRILAPGARVRLIVPDVWQLIDAYHRGDRAFFAQRNAYWNGARGDGPLLAQFLNYAGVGPDPGYLFEAHKYGYDFETLQALLEAAGFEAVERSGWMQSADPVFLVDDQSAVAGAEHSGGHYSLFVEAVVPARKAGAQSVAVAEERQPTVLTLMEAARREIDSGRPKAAAALLSEARSIDPANAQIARSMGVALAAAGELDAAEKSHREALALDPELAAARLHLGALLERRGNLRGAVSNYFRAISSAQARGRWLDASSTPHWLTSEVLHAMAMVNQNRVGLLMGLIEPLESRFGASAVQRVRAGLAHYLGHENHPPADPRQAPRFLHIPGLQPSPWLEPDLIDWLPALAERSEQIRQEAMDVFQQQADTGPFLRAPGGESLAPYLGGEQPRWDAFFFYRDGQESPSGAQLAPHTMAALRDVPLVRIKDHAPEICFSLLGPGSHIKPHYGVTNARVVVHLPLIVPEQCFLTVGGESRCWRYGRPWVFDDTFVHEAWNHSNETRVILLMDAWNPHLTEPERIAVTEIVEGIGEFNRCD